MSQDIFEGSMYRHLKRIPGLAKEHKKAHEIEVEDFGTGVSILEGSGAKSCGTKGSDAKGPYAKDRYARGFGAREFGSKTSSSEGVRKLKILTEPRFR